LKVGRSRRAFTLLELLVVIAIIAILSAIAFGVAGSAMESSRRSRAAVEIAAVEVALTRFETDNGFLPAIAYIAPVSTNYPGNPGTDAYRQSARALFFALTGRTKYDHDASSPTNHTAYIEFREIQISDRSVLGNTTLIQSATDAYTDPAKFGSGSLLKDPWGNPYGYHYNPDVDPGSLHNRTRPDIWSTAGDTNAAPEDHIRARWISNWARR
jgi:prepilin-type N-terminal cleavage/methylation domain-containing protein